MLSLQLLQIQRRKREKRTGIKVRRSCPKCGSKNLLRQGPDQFCCDCDWDTCFEYVESGLMNNLEVALRELFERRPTEKAENCESHTKVPVAPKSA
jgi:hypothetical protein